MKNAHSSKSYKPLKVAGISSLRTVKRKRTSFRQTKISIKPIPWHDKLLTNFFENRPDLIHQEEDFVAKISSGLAII